MVTAAYNERKSEVTSNADAVDAFGPSIWRLFGDGAREPRHAAYPAWRSHDGLLSRLNHASFRADPRWRDYRGSHERPERHGKPRSDSHPFQPYCADVRRWQFQRADARA